MDPIALLLDAAVVAVFVLTVAIFTYRGFTKSAMGFIVVVASFILCKMFGGVVGEWLDENFFHDMLYAKVSEILNSTFGEAADAMSADQLFDSMPDTLKNILDMAGADIADIKTHLMNFEGDVSSGIISISEKITTYISTAVCDLLGYVSVFIGSYVVLRILSFFIVKFMELPILHCKQDRRIFTRYHKRMYNLLGALYTFCYDNKLSVAHVPRSRTLFGYIGNVYFLNICISCRQLTISPRGKRNSQRLITNGF